MDSISVCGKVKVIKEEMAQTKKHEGMKVGTKYDFFSI
jgi:hypothetical protein